MGLEAGAQIGDYRVLSKLGEGASAAVYEGEHTLTKRREALKVLQDGRYHVPEEEERFLREIRLQASLQHPNIAAVRTAFSTPDGPVLVMELARGESLSAILVRGRIPLERGIDLVLQMLDGLAYAHIAGIVHRDIKPENVIVAPDWSVKLTDFGLARSAESPRLTQAGVFAGSPYYMAPEQAHATTDPDARTDTYSAGVVLYQVLTGRLPFDGDSTYEVLMAHDRMAPQRPCELEPAIGPEINRVILKALEKQPAKRYQTAGEFRAALENCRAVPVEAPTASTMWQTIIAAALGVAIAAVGVPTVLHLRRPEVVVAVPPVAAPAQAPALPAAVELPAVVESPAAVEPVVESEPKPVIRARKRAAPIATGLRITNASTESPVTAPAPVVMKPVVTPAAPQFAPIAAPAPVAPEDPPPAEEKRHNVMVRAFQKVVHAVQNAATSPEKRETSKQ